MHGTALHRTHEPSLSAFASNTPSQAVVSTINPLAHLHPREINKPLPFNQIYLKPAEKKTKERGRIRTAGKEKKNSLSKQSSDRRTNNHTPGTPNRTLEMAIILHQFLEFTFVQCNSAASDTSVADIVVVVVDKILSHFSFWCQVHACGELPGWKGFD